MFHATHLLHSSCSIWRLALVLAVLWPAAPEAGQSALAAPTPPTTPGFAQLAAGARHTCAVNASGGVVCWGSNDAGQLGDGTTTNCNAPVPVVGLESGAAALAAGGWHTCALTDAGGVLCWGGNGRGQLGDGTTEWRLTPVSVSGLESGVIALTAGVEHTCALTANGSVLCWGWNWHGQLGDGTGVDRWTPIQPYGLDSNVTALAAGGIHTCAVKSDVGTLCWGSNSAGELGDGTYEKRYMPTPVVGLGGDVASVTAGGNHTCAVTADGGLVCWGSNGLGQLGDGTVTGHNTPAPVSGLASGVTAVDASLFHTCAVAFGIGALCWGRNDYGTLGDGTTEMRLMPTPVSRLASGILIVTAGEEHTCALKENGEALCWGRNDLGQLGDGTVFTRSLAVEVNGLAGRGVALAVGDFHSCAASENGDVMCWGVNNAGQLGDGTTLDRITPVAVSGLEGGVMALAAGRGHTCALMVDGGVMCWGANADGQLGDGTTEYKLTPVPVSGLESGVMALAAGSNHTCAAAANGEALCWGDNWSGQLGDGTRTDRTTPVVVSGLESGVVALAAGYHTCALTNSGGVFCWGSNWHGQLGDGTFDDRYTPVPVSGLESGVTALAAGANHTCAVAAGGGAVCWGINETGQLGVGDGTLYESNVPVAVSGLENGVTALAAGEYHTCALVGSGGVMCWGANWGGLLGDGTNDDQLTPVQANGLEHNVSALALGHSHTCGLAAGRLKCWGYNDWELPSIFEIFLRLTPVAVIEEAQSLHLSYPNGQPGSYFTVSGWNFPPSGSASIAVNGYVFTETVPVNETGSFVFFFDTGAAEGGYYRVTAVVSDTTATTGFGLDAATPIRPQEGGGQTLLLPGGIGAPVNMIYLPVVGR